MASELAIYLFDSDGDLFNEPSDSSGFFQMVRIHHTAAQHQMPCVVWSDLVDAISPALENVVSPTPTAMAFSLQQGLDTAGWVVEASISPCLTGSGPPYINPQLPGVPPLQCANLRIHRWSLTSFPQR